MGGRHWEFNRPKDSRNLYQVYYEAIDDQISDILYRCTLCGRFVSSRTNYCLREHCRNVIMLTGMGDGHVILLLKEDEDMFLSNAI